MAANTAKNSERPRIVEAQDSVTRPANATQYADGDALSDNATLATIAGVFQIDFASGAGRSLLLTDFTLHKSDHDVTTAAFSLLIFDAIPAYAGFEDNAALAITDTEFLTCKGIVSFTAAGWGNVITGDIQTVSQEIGYVPTTAETKLFGIIALAGTYTPASGEIFTLTVKAKVL